MLPAKNRYKLQLLRLDEDGEKFVDDMSLWPTVEYGHIYFIDCPAPGVFTKYQLLQWKNLEAYYYFLSGHVHMVKLWILKNASSCIA